MAVKRYDGSAWQTVAGLGAQGAAATSSTITTWVKTAAGGETSLSGNDDNSQSLSYTIGQELVFINGSLQKRGSDYTATSGTSINGLTALAANDVVTVWSNNAFSVTNAISNTLVDAKGDILVGTAADTPGRLGVGTDGQVLTAASTTGTGLVWSDTVTDATTTTAARGFGYMGIPQSSAATTGSYTIVAADAGEHIYSTATRTITIPANASVAFPVGTAITFVAATGATVTIAITSDTLLLAGPGTTGSRTLAPFGMATALKITSTSWIISGNGLT